MWMYFIFVNIYRVVNRFYLLILKHISWSWNVSGPLSTLSHNPLNLCNKTSTALSSTEPCKRYSWFGIMLDFNAALRLSIAVLIWLVISFFFLLLLQILSIIFFALQIIPSPLFMYLILMYLFPLRLCIQLVYICIFLLSFFFFDPPYCFPLKKTYGCVQIKLYLSFVFFLIRHIVFV